DLRDGGGDRGLARLSCVVRLGPANGIGVERAAMIWTCNLRAATPGHVGDRPPRIRVVALIHMRVPVESQLGAVLTKQPLKARAALEINVRGLPCVVGVERVMEQCDL